jgi:hypothetical protein
MPKLEFLSNAKPSLFDYPKPTKIASVSKLGKTFAPRKMKVWV